MSVAERLAWNTATRWASNIVAGLVGLWVVPYLAGHLGVAAYGTTELMATLVAFSLMADLGQREAVIRYFAGAVSTQDHKSLAHYFSAAVVSYTSVAVVVGLVLILSSTKIVDIFKIPESQRPGALLLVRYYVTIYTLLCFLSPTYAAVIEACHRFDVADMAHLLEVILRPFAFLITIGYYGLELNGWALSMLACKLASLTFLMVSAHWLVPFKVRLRYFTIPAFKDLWLLSVAIFLFQFSLRLNTLIDPIVLAMQLGPEAVAIYKPALLVVTLGYPFIAGLTRQFRPLAIEHWSKGQKHIVEEILLRGTRLTIVASALFCAITIPFGIPLARTWLGNQFGDDAVVTGWCLMGLAIADISSHIRQTQGFITLGVFRIRLATFVQVSGAILAGMMGWGCIGILKARNWEMWSVLGIVGPAVIVSWIQAATTSVAIANSMGVGIRRYLATSFVVPLSTLTATIGIGFGIKYFVQPQGLVGLTASVALTTVAWAVLAWPLGLDAQERGQILRLFENLVSRAAGVFGKS